MKRTTIQKQVILNYLKTTKNHPSAQMIFQEAKKKIPCLSISTVYRILDDLIKSGQIQQLPGEIRRFDGNLCPHAHFFCEKCKKIFDVKFNFSQNKLKVGKIKKYQIYLYGICQECLKNKLTPPHKQNKKQK